VAKQCQKSNLFLDLGLHCLSLYSQYLCLSENRIEQTKAKVLYCLLLTQAGSTKLAERIGKQEASELKKVHDMVLYNPQVKLSKEEQQKLKCFRQLIKLNEF
jgi:hypothetical protein